MTINLFFTLFLQSMSESIIESSPESRFCSYPHHNQPSARMCDEGTVVVLCVCVCVCLFFLFCLLTLLGVQQEVSAARVRKKQQN